MATLAPPPRVIGLQSLSITPVSEEVKLSGPLTSLSAKSSFLDTTPPASSRRRIFVVPTLAQWEKVIFAAAPVLLHLTAVALAVVQLVQLTIPMLDLRQIGGTGRLEYFVMASCSVAPGSTSRVCNPRSVNADFVPSLLAIAPAVPGFALQQLPVYSSQTPTIYTTSLVAICVSFLLFLPVWTLAYFPKTIIIHPALTRVIRRFAWYCYFLAGLLAFASMILSLTVGISWKLILQFDGTFFIQYIEKAYFQGVGQVYDTSSFWKMELKQQGFVFTWAQATFAGLVVIGTKAALHNLMDEKVERYGQDEENIYGDLRY